MRKAFTRSAAIVAATVAPLCIVDAAPASAAPTGPVTLTASPTQDGKSIELIYNATLAGSIPIYCTSIVQGVGFFGESIVTRTPIRLFGGTPVIVSPKKANTYAITYTCNAGEVGDASSSNGSPLYVTVSGQGPVGGSTPFGS